MGFVSSLRRRRSGTRGARPKPFGGQAVRSAWVVVGAVVVTARAPFGEVVGVVVPTLFVDVVRFGGVGGFATVSTRHSNTRSEQSRQSVTVWPGWNSSVSGLSEVFKNVSRNSPMNGGARS